MNKEFLNQIENYIKEHTIVEYDKEDKYRIDSFDILNAPNRPILVDYIYIDKNRKVTFKGEKGILLEKNYETSLSIEDIFSDIYEEIVFLNFLGTTKEQFEKNKILP